MKMNSNKSPNPKVGQLLYTEHCSESNKFLHASLIFIDEEPQQSKQWYITQIAHMEKEDGILKGFGNFEAGATPKVYTRLATDDDILKFIKLLKNNSIKGNLVTESSTNFEDWLRAIKEDEILLQIEKQRIEKLAANY